ncbi:anaphase-promoting complex subunit cdc27 [Taxawa tesnikishii (nom. ined.)]|nr:anaphase-promoting complex subunit cdc27 [Dothideales sp. JES 119]
MSPAATLAVGQLKQLIFYHLDNEMPDNANFLAGRLHAMEPRNPDTSHLLALTYLRSRRPKAAYDYSQKVGETFRRDQCAGEGKEPVDHEEQLEYGYVVREVNNLLGKLWRGHGDVRRAGDCYIEAHKGNPFVWDAFQGLCDIGAKLDAANTFKATPEMMSSLPMTSVTPAHEDIVEEQSTIQLPLSTQTSFGHQSMLTPSNDSFNPGSRAPNEAGPRRLGSNSLLPKIRGANLFGSSAKALDQSTWETPTANGNHADDDVEMGGIQPERLGLESSKDKDIPKMRPHSLRSQYKSQESTEGEEAMVSATSQAQKAASNHKRTISGHASKNSTDLNGDPTAAQAPRRSNRLFSQITGSKTASKPPADHSSTLPGKRDGDLKKAKATGVRGRGASTVGRVVSGNRKFMPPVPGDMKESRAPTRGSVAIPNVSSQRISVEPTGIPDSAAMESLLAIFRQLGTAYHSLSQFALSTAIETFKSLPTLHRETPWVLAQLGKAHYEAADYASAETYFARMLKLQPTRVEDTEVYSTVLWHLKKPAQLAFLAHTLRDLDFNAPQTWCAAGNAFSLNREHEQAIACFKRATQVDAGFGYAWTLLGHEYLANEEFDAALAAFRKGLGSERRGYGGWYGLGKCYERMGKWEEAERYYRIATTINPGNAVLMVCIGVRARALQKARVLMNMRHYHEALAELDALKVIAPDEANVFFLLGKCYKGLGDRALSVRAFTTALNLDAKAAQYIKEAMEALDETDEDGSEDD